MRLALFTFAAMATILSAGPAIAAEQTVTLSVDNMYCATCAPTVKKSLARVKGVTEVEVSREHHTATVTFDDTKTSVAALINATTNAGYPSHLAN